MQNPIIVALDVSTAEEALALARELADTVGAFKVGKELFVSAGPDIVRAIRDTGGAVFLDLKFHDIPNTVAKAVAAAARLDVQMLTLHTSGGRDMMAAAEAEAQEADRPPLVLGVTVLTSMDGHDLDEIGLSMEPAAQVKRLAQLAHSAGLRGLVCSPREIMTVRQALPREMQLVTPGIRPAGSDVGDQKRTLTPAEAISAGANWLVIGRPITGAGNPRQAAENILQSLPD
ncbi:MAG: orotidine-5'-phosphate decarboxylase [Verrucomicrobiales bacterium]|nr:orotidine-5'-phosphate decarboxylase [Verrucomicrobiales bacterium]